MIDTDNLRTASLYINNQLLSRGLIKDGQSIDFASPCDGDDGAFTMGRIISVVNDLILRRDRDAAQRESLSATMRALRTDNLKLTNDVTRLSEKSSEAQRKLDIAESSETAARTQLRSAEAAVRGLKEEMARTKALVAQARSACANDVRRRDRQIDTLKKQLGEAGRPRGTRASPAITTINVTGDFGAEKQSAASKGNTATEEYSLRSETNGFLAKLAQDLSEENEAILNAMRHTMTTLRHMSGYSKARDGDGNAVKQPSWEDMAFELDSVLEHMKTILTNPSFVPIEEVEVREEEINRLKDGWVKMENRWKEAVLLIDSWRKRMAASGEPVREDELQMSLRLSPIRVGSAKGHPSTELLGLSTVAEEGDRDMSHAQRSPCPAAAQHARVHGVQLDEQDESSLELTGLNNDSAMADEDWLGPKEEQPNFEVLQEPADEPQDAFSRESSPLPEPPQLSPLRASPSAGNRRAPRAEKTKERPGDFSTIIEENTRDLEEKSPPKPSSRRGTPKHAGISKTRGQGANPRRSPARTSLEEALLPQPESETEDALAAADYSTDEDELAAAPPQKTPRRETVVSKLPLPKEEATQQSPLTMANIAAKLAASEREADAARVRAKLRALRGVKETKQSAAATAAVPAPEPASKREEPEEDGDGDPVKQDPSAQKQVKRKRDKGTSRVHSRRRSTLSPWELDKLMAGNVQ